MSRNSRATTLVELAAEQWGIITSKQARAAASSTPQQLKRMTDAGVLERLHHGFYRLTRIPHDRYMAERLAWIALDPQHLAWERLGQDVPTGVLSHHTAAALHNLGDHDADIVELTAIRRIRLSIPDVKVHRGTLGRDDWQIVNELPVTTPVRTITDLASAGIDAGHLASIVRDALTYDLTTTEQAATALAPHAFDYGHRALDGRTFLTALIDQAGVPSTTLDAAAMARRHTFADLYEHANANLLRQFTKQSAPAFEQLNAEITRTIAPALNALADPAIRDAIARTAAANVRLPQIHHLQITSHGDEPRPAPTDQDSAQ